MHARIKPGSFAVVLSLEVRVAIILARYFFHRDLVGQKTNKTSCSRICPVIFKTIVTSVPLSDDRVANERANERGSGDNHPSPSPQTQNPLLLDVGFGQWTDGQFYLTASAPWFARGKSVVDNVRDLPSQHSTAANRAS